MTANLAQNASDAPRGLFITFEGGEAAGKSTQVRLLQKACIEAGLQVLVTFEPGDSALGKELRRQVMNGPQDVDPRTEALLYAADRAYHVATKIRPALQAGKVVICDRYIDSSVAYQGMGRDLGEQEIRQLSEWATDGLNPDIAVLLDLDLDTAAHRLAERGMGQDRIEGAGRAFHKQVRAAFLNMAQESNGRICRIDGSKTVEEVKEDIFSVLEQLPWFVQRGIELPREAK